MNVAVVDLLIARIVTAMVTTIVMSVMEKELQHAIIVDRLSIAKNAGMVLSIARIVLEVDQLIVRTVKELVRAMIQRTSRMTKMRMIGN